MVCDTAVLLNDAIRDGKTVLFEGAQGTMLDIDHGTYPFVTSSSASAGGACTGTGVAPTRIHGVIGVSKAYITRVGGGPFPTEALDDAGELIRAARQGIRRRDRPSAPLRLVRRAAAALHRHDQRLRQHRRHQARRAGRVRPDSGLRRLSHRRQGSLRHAGDGGRDREDRAGVRVRARLEHATRSASRTTTNCRRRPRTTSRFWRRAPAWKWAASPPARSAIRPSCGPARASKS